jgi:hypothetical protein
MYMALAWSILDLLTVLATVNKPRDEVTPFAAVLAGIVVLTYAVPFSWILFNTDSETVMTLAFMLLVCTAVGTANLVRQTAGVRGEKTALGTFAVSLAGVFEVCAITAILALT